MNVVSCHLANRLVENAIDDSPMLRRASDTEAVLSVDLKSSEDLSCCETVDESYSSISSSFSILSMRNHVHQTIDELAEASEDESVCEKEQEEAKRCALRHAEAHSQQQHVHRNAKIILRDDDMFRQFQQAIKKTGMLTANGVRQVLLSPTVGDNRQHSCTTRS